MEKDGSMRWKNDSDISYDRFFSDESLVALPSKTKKAKPALTLCEVNECSDDSSRGDSDGEHAEVAESPSVLLQLGIERTAAKSRRHRKRQEAMLSAQKVNLRIALIYQKKQQVPFPTI